MINILMGSNLLLMREGLRRVIEPHPDLVIAAEVAHVEDIFQCDRIFRCQVAVIALPFACFWDGEFYRLLRKTRPDMPIVVITDSNRSEFVSSVMKSGARGILGKDLVVDNLLSAIREVVSGRVYVGKEVVTLIANRFSMFRNIYSESNLTQRETQILKRLAIGRKTGTIGVELGISSKTVSTHKARIMEKLALSSDTELVRYAMENKLFDLFVDHSQRKMRTA